MTHFNSSERIAIAEKHGKLKVLLAEDNEVNQLLAKSILRFWNFEYKVAITGNQVLDLLTNEDFDLVLMDIQMPEKSGIDAAIEIRALTDEKKKNIPIIALTANALKGEEKKYLEVGMNDYLTKPFKEKELYQVIDRVFSNKATFGSRFEAHPETDELNLPDASKKLYDLTLVNQLTGSNRDFIKDLAKVFIDTIPANAQQIQDACEKKDWVTMSKVAHKIKSTIDTMMILSIKEDIRSIEINGKNEQQLHTMPMLIKRVKWVIQHTATQLKAEFEL
jgi:CheY-like chemotaxis protein/HPt (histidine-containing phosphotransfer) domain-containing protein